MRLLSLLLAAPLIAAPLSDAQKGVLDAIPEDPPPEELDATREDLKGRHYLSGDEANLQLFLPRVKDLGGAYAGVGSDQAYLFAGWQKPELVFVTDYDPWIKWLHLAYAAFFKEAEDLTTFRQLWKEPKVGLEVIKTAYEGRTRRKVSWVFARAAHKVNRRLRRLEKWSKARGFPSFASDDEQYRFVRQLVLEGRVRPLVCNLLESQCLVGLGAALKQVGVPLRVLYTSNAEQYWDYSDQFRANMQAQNFDEKSVVLRTLASKRSANKDYQYNSQSGPNFQAWLKHSWVKRVRTIVPMVFIKSADHLPLTHTDADPEAVRSEREAKKAKKREKKRK